MPERFDDDTELLIARGREAWGRLRKDETWESWIEVGRAIEAGRGAMMRRLQTNSAAGKVWSERFGAWLEQNEFDKIDKGVRSRLQSCLDNLPAIEAWRQTLTMTQRLQLNHPNTIIRRWQAATQHEALIKERDDKPRPQPLASATQLRRELDAAQAHITELEHAVVLAKEARAVMDGMVDLEWGQIPEIAAKLVASSRWPAIEAAVAQLRKTTRKRTKALDDPSRPRNRERATG
jgi:hypothetical protein